MSRFFMIAGVLSLSFGFNAAAQTGQAATQTATQAAEAGERQYDMRVDGLTCPFCVATSTKALKKIKGVTEVAVDLDAGLISVCAGPDADLSDVPMTKLFRKKGFTYRSQTQLDGCVLTDEPREAAAPKAHKGGAAHGDDQSHEEGHDHGSGHGSDHGPGYGS